MAWNMVTGEMDGRPRRFDPLTGTMVEDEQAQQLAVDAATMPPPAPAPAPVAPTAAARPGDIDLDRPETFGGFALEPPPGASAAGYESQPITTTSSDRVVQSRGAKAAAKGLDAAYASQRDALSRKGELDAKTARIDADAAGERARLAAEREAEAQRVREEQDAIIAGKRREYDDAVESWKGAKIKDYWSDKSTGDKALAALSVAMGSFGAALTGRGQNDALRILDNAIERDYKLQTDRIQKMSDSVAMARAGVKDADAARDKLLADVDARHSLILDRMGAMVSARKAQLGPEAAGVNADAAAALLEEKKAANDLQREQRYESKAHSQTVVGRVPRGTGRGPGPGGVGEPKEFQYRAEKTLIRALNEGARLESLPQLSVEGRELMKQELALQAAARANPTSDMIITKLTGLRQKIQEKLSENDRRAYRAGKQFLEPFLRDDTGAAIGPDEMVNKVDGLLPVAGDGPKDLEDKRNARIEQAYSVAAGTRDPARWKVEIDRALRRRSPAQSGGPQLVEKYDPGSQKIVRGRVLPNGDFEVVEE